MFRRNKDLSLKYKAYNKRNFERIDQLHNIPERISEEIFIMSHVFPFRANNYIVDSLINWKQIATDPIFKITFPNQKMLTKTHYRTIKKAVKSNYSQDELRKIITDIRLKLNPNPAGQMIYNQPRMNDEILNGVQHKYRETVLFFPSQGQTCHAFCTFCFRWNQFIENKEMKFSSNNLDNLISYLQAHTEVQDILITGGDPMFMRANQLERYIKPLLEIKHLNTIRIGTRTLTFWPYRYVSDKDSDHILNIFSEIEDASKHLALMAHFNHTNELKTSILEKAVKNVRNTGAQIRTQSPLLKHINDSPQIWSRMWKKQVKLGMIPYYMFVARNTGAKHYFELPLVKALKIFNNATNQISGLSKTARGPVMSSFPGKVHILGCSVINNQKVLVLKFIQARNPTWIGKIFYAKYNAFATWLDQLEPAFSEEFFYSESLREFKYRKEMEHQDKIMNYEHSEVLKTFDREEQNQYTIRNK